MTNEQPTIYKFAYYYTTGDGSGDSEPYTNKDEAIEAFREFVKDEITDEWTAEDEVMDYAKLYVYRDDEGVMEEDYTEEIILLWSFEWGFTKCDQPTSTPKELLLEESAFWNQTGAVMKEGYTHEDYVVYLNGLTLEELREEFITRQDAETIEKAIEARDLFYELFGDE